MFILKSILSFNSKLNVTALKNGFGYGSLKIDIGGISK